MSDPVIMFVVQESFNGGKWFDDPDQPDECANHPADACAWLLAPNPNFQGMTHGQTKED